MQEQVKEGVTSVWLICWIFFFRANNLLHLCDDNNQSISIQEGAEGVTAAWLAKRNVINKIPTTTFHSHNFKQIMAYLLQKSQTKYVFNI
jgi:hypothetical protein